MKYKRYVNNIDYINKDNVINLNIKVLSNIFTITDLNNYIRKILIKFYYQYKLNELEDSKILFYINNYNFDKVLDLTTITRLELVFDLYNVYIINKKILGIIEYINKNNNKTQILVTRLKDNIYLKK